MGTSLLNKKVVLTGGCGFIGSSLIPKLISAGVSDLIVADKLGYASTLEVVNDYELRLIKGDLADDKIIQVIKGVRPDVVIHMAAESHVDNSISNPEAFLQSNVVATYKLLEMSRSLDTLQLFLQISTDEVYGSVATGYSKEDDKRVCSSPYSSTKGAAELLVEAWGTTFKLPVMITRSSNNYGPFQHTEKLIPKAITNLLQGKKIPIYGSGDNYRDWLYVGDNCNGLIKVIENGSVGEAYNVGGSSVISNNQIIERLCSILNRSFEDSVTYVTDRAGHDFRYALDSSKTQALGWDASVELTSGLQQTIKWYEGR